MNSIGNCSASPISSFFAADLILSCVVFVIWLRNEAKRQPIRHRWLYLMALLGVGLSLALPLFLLAREERRHETPQRAAMTTQD